MNHFKIPVALGAVQTLSQYQQLARKLKAYLVTQNMYVKQIFLYRYHAISTNVRIFQINKNYLLSSIYHAKLGNLRSYLGVRCILIKLWDVKLINFPGHTFLLYV